MQLFPSLHSRTRKSRLNVNHELQRWLESSDRDAARSIWDSALEVVVEPGQLLYIPPFWYHHVEALEFSVSVSVVSDAAEALLQQRWVAHVADHLSSFMRG